LSVPIDWNEMGWALGAPLSIGLLVSVLLALLAGKKFNDIAYLRKTLAIEVSLLPLWGSVSVACVAKYVFLAGAWAVGLAWLGSYFALQLLWNFALNRFDLTRRLLTQGNILLGSSFASKGA
jgi:hypothetical protein